MTALPAADDAQNLGPAPRKRAARHLSANLHPGQRYRYVQVEIEQALARAGGSIHAAMAATGYDYETVRGALQVQLRRVRSRRQIL